MQIEKAKDSALDLFYAQEQLLTHYGASLTISDTIRRPTIQNLVKTHGNDYVVFFVTGLLNELLSFVPTSLTGAEVVLYSDNIIASFPTWSPEDIILCLKNGMSGKYGPTTYHWKWNPNFVEWAKRYNQEKDDFFHDRHVKAKTEGAIQNAELIKLFPKELLEKFAKESFADKSKEKMLDTKIPDDVIAQGIEAVDAYIEKIRNQTNKQK